MHLKTQSKTYNSQIRYVKLSRKGWGGVGFHSSFSSHVASVASPSGRFVLSYALRLSALSANERALLSHRAILVHICLTEKSLSLSEQRLEQF